jgi:hypothetical protein
MFWLKTPNPLMIYPIFNFCGNISTENTACRSSMIANSGKARAISFLAPNFSFQSASFTWEA